MGRPALAWSRALPISPAYHFPVTRPGFPCTRALPSRAAGAVAGCPLKLNSRVLLDARENVATLIKKGAKVQVEAGAGAKSGYLVRHLSLHAAPRHFVGAA